MIISKMIKFKLMRNACLIVSNVYMPTSGRLQQSVIRSFYGCMKIVVANFKIASRVAFASLYSIMILPTGCSI